MSISLEDITLVCIDTRNINAALNSMSCSLSQVKFTKSILFTSESLCSEEIVNKAQTHRINIEFITELNSITDYSLFVLAELDKYITSKFCLVTQWDSWVIESKYWNSNFFQYDYIGATWPHYSIDKVGNGGFSLRSKKLLEASREFIKDNPIVASPLIEDDYICRENRSKFEDLYHIKFSPIEMANEFSVERNGLPNKSFGFHGFFNFNVVIKNDSVLKKLISSLNDECFLDIASYDLTKSLLKEKRISIAKQVLRRRISATGISTKNARLAILLLIKAFKF
jgi:hypothetical protein